MLNYNLSQKPFSVSYYNNDIVGFTIEDRGETSNKMINSNIGDYFGLTGPLGSYFKMDKSEKLLLIGGGIGIAPLLYLTSYLIKKKKKADILFGGKDKYTLEFTKNIKKNKNLNINIYSEDGSIGNKGLVTKDLDAYINKNKYDTLYICGPEIMMNIVINKIKSKIKNIQVCMERYMKCGLGICGTCTLDNTGDRVCVEGPVFQYNDSLINSKEFGIYHRNKNGIIEKF